MRLGIEQQKLFCCNHPTKQQKGEVCLYFKDRLLLALRPDLNTLDECLVCGILNGSVLLPKSNHRVIFFIQTKLRGNNH